MDEMRFVVCDGNKVYGHSAKGTPCVAVAKFNEEFILQSASKLVFRV